MVKKAKITGIKLIKTGGNKGGNNMINILKSSAQQKNIEYTNENLIEPPYDPYALAATLDANTWHKRCINLISACTSDIGWHIEGKDVIENKKLENWVKNSTEDEDFSSMLTKFVIDEEIFGNAWLEISRDVVTNKPARIYHGRAVSIRVLPDATGHIKGFVQKKNSTDFFFRKYSPENQYSASENEMLQMIQYHPLYDWYGVPSWLPALAAITGDKSSMEYNLNFFSNNAIPPGLLIIKGGQLDEDSEKALKTFVEENLKGIDNAHRLAIIPLDDPDQEVELKEFGATMKDQAFGEFRKMNREEIAGIHGVPPRLLGIITAGSLGGSGEVEGQLIIFKETLIQPLQRKIEYILNNQIVRRGLGLENSEIKLNGLDITLQQNDASTFEALSTAYTQLVQAGIVGADYAAEKLSIAKSAAPKKETLRQQILKIQKSINDKIYID